MTISFPLKGDADKKIGAAFAPLSVSAQLTPNLTVQVRAGTFFNSHNVLVEYVGGISHTLTPPTSNAKWVLVGLTDAGVLTTIDGVSAPKPDLPVLPSGILPLAAVYLVATSSSITDQAIADIRPFVRSIDNVPNLSAELVNRPTFLDLSVGLAGKADTTGTPSASFLLNSSFVTGAPYTNAEISVKRGAQPDVSIRWNETLSSWEFTNNGVSFSPFVSSIGTFAPTLHTHVAADITNLTTTVATQLSSATFAQTQVTNLQADLANKASASTLSAHVANAGIHFTLPISQSDVTGLVSSLSSKVNVTGPNILTGDLTIQNVGTQPITLSSVDSGSSGLLVTRPALPTARFEWDETSAAWLIGVTGSMNTVLTSVSVNNKIDKVVGAGVGNIPLLTAQGTITDSGVTTSAFAPISHTHAFSSLTSMPTTLSGYGITNAYTKLEVDSLTWGWSSIISTPTTLAGYGITNAVTSNTLVVGGTYTKITFDTKGLVTGGSLITASDVPQLAQTQITGLTADLSNKSPITNPLFQGAVGLPIYTTTTLPLVGTGGGLIYVSNATPGPTICFSNGTSWIDVITHVAVV